MPFGVANVACSRIRERMRRCVGTGLLRSLWCLLGTTLLLCRARSGPLGTLWRSSSYVRVHLIWCTTFEPALRSSMVLTSGSLHTFLSFALEFEWDGFKRSIVLSVGGFMPLATRSVVSIVLRSFPLFGGGSLRTRLAFFRARFLLVVVFFWIFEVQFEFQRS